MNCIRTDPLPSLVWILLVVVLSAISLAAPPREIAETALPEATPQHLPTWHGFNLLEKFYDNGNNPPFVETDFQYIHELGFNFVRLPMDYRVWIQNRDWNQFNEQQLEQIDQAIQWG